MERKRKVIQFFKQIWPEENRSSDGGFTNELKEIDEDHIPIQEEPCKRKYPRIGDHYQAVEEK